MTIPVHHVVDLDQRAFLSAWKRHDDFLHFVIVARDGTITRVGDDFQFSKIGKLDSDRVYSISLSDDGQHMAYSTVDEVAVLDLDENQSFGSFSLKYNYAAVSFDQHLLWIAHKLPNSKFLVEAYDARSLQQLAKLELDNHYRGLSASFYRLPKTAEASFQQLLWIASGDGDAQLVFLSYDRHQKIQAVAPAELLHCCPISMAPTNDQFVVMQPGNCIKHFTYPDFKLIGQALWPINNEFDDALAERCQFIDSSKALVSTHEGRILKVDLNQYRVGSDLILEGHESPAVKYYHSHLSGTGTDISYYFQVDQFFVTVNRRHKSECSAWMCTLNFFKIQDIVNHW